MVTPLASERALSYRIELPRSAQDSLRLPARLCKPLRAPCEVNSNLRHTSQQHQDRDCSLPSRPPKPFPHPTNMGRGKSWEALARAGIAASEDVVGANQKAKKFGETLHRCFIEKGPEAGAVSEGKYGFRSVASCKNHFADFSADAQKFCSALRKVRASNPTGVNEDNIHSMAVAIHIEKTEVMDYSFKDYFTGKWLSFKAWKRAKSHPKWLTHPSEISSESDGRDTSSFDHGPPSTAGGTSNEEAIQSRNAVATPTKSVERFRIARNAKMIRQC